MVLPAPDPATSPIIQSTAFFAAEDDVDPVEDKDPCLVLFADKSRQPHWSTDSALFEEVDTVEEVEFDLLGMIDIALGIMFPWLWWDMDAAAATEVTRVALVPTKELEGVGGEWGEGGEQEEEDRDEDEQGKAFSTTGRIEGWNWLTIIEGRRWWWRRAGWWWCSDSTASSEGEDGLPLESALILLLMEEERDVEAEAFLLFNFKSWNKLMINWVGFPWIRCCFCWEMIFFRCGKRAW